METCFGLACAVFYYLVSLFRCRVLGRKKLEHYLMILRCIIRRV